MIYSDLFRQCFSVPEIFFLSAGNTIRHKIGRIDIEINYGQKVM